MLFQGCVEYRYCRYPAEAFRAWQTAVQENQARKKAKLPLLTFNEPWMPRSPFFNHCKQDSPRVIVPQQQTRFYTGWFVGQMDLDRPTFHAWIERYKLLLPRERTGPHGAQGVGNLAIRKYMEKYFPGKIAEVRAFGKRLPFKGRNCSGIQAFNDPDVVTFDEATGIWGFYEVKCESEIRRSAVHTNQSASLGFLRESFGDNADVALVIVVEEGKALSAPNLQRLEYRFALMP